MSFTGSFRQHFSSANFVGDRFNFANPINPSTSHPIANASYIETANNILGVSGTDIQEELTLNVWLYPENTNTAYIFSVPETASMEHSYLAVNANTGTILFEFNGTGVTNFNAGIVLNQWNQILISIKLDLDTILTFGNDSGATFDMTTKRSYNTGSGRSSRTHLVVNGVGYHRYIEPGSSGFFQNDFAINSTNLATMGYYGENNSLSSELFTSDNVTNTLFGTIGLSTNGTEILNGYRGDMYQFWLKNSYTDFLDANNVALFRNANGTSRDDLPANPRVHIVGGPNFNIGTTDLGTVDLYNIIGSNRAYP